MTARGWTWLADNTTPRSSARRYAILSVVETAKFTLGSVRARAWLAEGAPSPAQLLGAGRLEQAAEQLDSLLRTPASRALRRRGDDDADHALPPLVTQVELDDGGAL